MGEFDGVLGVVWVRQFNLDTCLTYLMESSVAAQLHLRRRRLRPLSSLPPPQSISRPLRNRRQNIQDLTDRSRGTPCWSRNRNQDPLLCASKSCEERFGRRCRAATSSRCTSGRKSCRTVFLILEPCNIISARR